MATVNFAGNPGDPYDDPYGWSPGPVTSSPFDTSSFSPSYQAPLTQAYQTSLGRDPGAGEVDRWWNMRPGDLNDRLTSLGETTEAKNWAARTPQTPGEGGSDPHAFWRQWSQGNRARQSDPQSLVPFVDYLKQQGVNATLDARTDGLHKGIYLNGDPNQFIKLLDGYDNPIWMPGGDQPGGGAGSTDPSSELYLNELLSRMDQLRQPVEDPLAPLYQLMALTRVQNLQGEPFTAGDDAALTARYMSPLTQARDASLQRNKERIGARGMLPTSGLLDELNRDTEATYEQNVAAGSNDLAVRAVQERQRRQQEQLGVLSDLLRFSKGQRGEDDQRSQELIELASMFPEFDERRLDMLLRASGDNSAAQASSAALGQQSQQLQRDFMASRDQADRDAAWGRFFASIMDNWDDIF